jgi:hypothetical protein
MLRQANSKPLASFILQTPQYKKSSAELPEASEPDKQKNTKRSPRLKEKGTKGNNIIKKAQELVAKKCGILGENQEMDNMTL